MTNDVVALHARSADAATAAALGAERVGRHRLDVLLLCHHDDEFFVFDEVFDAHLADVGGDLAHARGGEGVLHFRQLAGDDAAKDLVVFQDRRQFLDACANLFLLGLQVDPRQLGQLTQLHVENVDRLALAETELLAHESVFGGVGVFAGADHLDDFVDHVEGLQAALENVVAFLRLVEAVLAATSDDFDLVVDVAADGVAQVERARHAFDERHHVDRELALQLGVLEQVVHHDVGVGVTLERDDEVGGAAGRVVVHVGDALEAVVVDQFLDARGDGRATRLVRQLGHDDAHLAALAFFDRHLGAHLDAAATGLVRVGDAFATEDQPAGREVGTLHELHEVFHGRLGVVEQVQRGIDDFAQVVRRDRRGHADRDALRAVDEQVGEPRRQHRGFFGGAVVVRHQVDGVLLDVGEQLHGQRVQARFGVAAGGRAEVRRAVVAVEVDERVAQRERLGHAHEGVVDRAVAVRVVAGHRVAGDACALHVRSVGTEALLVHVPDDSTVHGLQAVAHVGQRARHDRGDRVVEERTLHFFLQLDGLHRVAARQRQL